MLPSAASERLWQRRAAAAAATVTVEAALGEVQGPSLALDWRWKPRAAGLSPANALQQAGRLDGSSSNLCALLSPPEALESSCWEQAGPGGGHRRAATRSALELLSMSCAASALPGAQL